MAETGSNAAHDNKLARPAAFSVCGLLTSPQARGAFDKAAVQSGNCLVKWTKNTWSPGVPTISAYLPVDLAETFGADAGARLGCPTVDCLRGKGVKELMALDLPFNAPSFGTPLLPLEPREALRAGRFHRVPVLSGSTRDEQSWMIAIADQQSPITPQVYERLLVDSFGEHADAVGARYPLAAYESPALAWSAVSTDRAWSCPTLEGTGLLTTPEQRKLSAQMIGYWSNFARAGSPNGWGLPLWPRFPHAQSLEHGPRGADLSERHNCELWSTIP